MGRCCASTSDTKPIAACHAAELQRFYTAEFNSYLKLSSPLRVSPRWRWATTASAGAAIGSGTTARPTKKLLSLDNWESHLKPGIRAAFLEQQARRMSDTECALRMQQRKRKTAGGLPVTVVRQRPETGLSARDSSGMGGGGGSSTSFLVRSTTLQSFPSPLTPLPPRHPHT